MKPFTTDLCSFLVISSLSMGIGFVINSCQDDPLPMVYRKPAERLSAERDAEPLVSSHRSGGLLPERGSLVSKEIGLLSLDELCQMREEGRLLIIDVRPDLFYKLGHIPGAHSLQEKEFEKDLAKMKSILESALEDGKKIVLYCGGSHCGDASKVAVNLAERGYGNLLIFEAGWEGWQQAGLEEDQIKF
jgi:rhodanese-related sulfurtransferase